MKTSISPWNTGKMRVLAASACIAALAGCSDSGGSSVPDTSPVVHIVSPAAGASVARGEGRPGAGSFNGTGFALNLEVVTRDAIGVAAQEGLNIRIPVCSAIRIQSSRA